jgi:hypothetical protein
MAFVDEDGNWIQGQAPRRPGAAAPGQVPTVPGPVATPPIPSIKIGAFNPDYKALIKGDPGYVSWLASANERRTNAATQRAQAIKTLVMRYGGIPKGFKDAFGDVDQGTLGLAGENQFSESALLDKGYKQGVENLRRTLAARGGLQSGELGHGQEQADFNRGVGEYNLGQDFLNAVNGALGEYTGTIGGVNAEESGVLGEAQGRVVTQYQPSEGVPANLVSDWQQYGEPVYQTEDGKLWRISPATGQPEEFTPPPPATYTPETQPAPAPRTPTLQELVGRLL